MNYSISARLHGHFCRLDFARQSSETSLERHELTIEEFRSFLPVRDFIRRAWDTNRTVATINHQTPIAST